MPGGPGGPGGEGFGGLFEHLFTGQGPRGERKRKAKAVLHLLDVSLSEVYSGTKKKMKFTRDRICKDCEGRGGKGDSITECARCKGRGQVIEVISRGFMMTQSISACDVCRGRGKVIKDKCTKCNAKGYVPDVKIENIDVEKGTPDGHRYVFKGEADEYVILCRKKYVVLY
jgi:DnaJ homolog subfamily A member 2